MSAACCRCGTIARREINRCGDNHLAIAVLQCIIDHSYRKFLWTNSRRKNQCFIRQVCVLRTDRQLHRYLTFQVGDAGHPSDDGCTSCRLIDLFRRKWQLYLRNIIVIQQDDTFSTVVSIRRYCEIDIGRYIRNIIIDSQHFYCHTLLTRRNHYLSRKFKTAFMAGRQIHCQWSIPFTLTFNSECKGVSLRQFCFRGD